MSFSPSKCGLKTNNGILYDRFGPSGILLQQFLVAKDCANRNRRYLYLRGVEGNCQVRNNERRE